MKDAVSSEASDLKAGTPADLTVRARIPRKGSQPAALSSIMMREFDPRRWKAEGYKWFRVTAPADDPTHAYLECWWQKPEIEGELDRSKAI